MTKQPSLRTFALLRWVTMLVWGLLVLLLTTLPGDLPPLSHLMYIIGETEVIGTAGHISLFALLTALLWRALSAGFGVRQALLVALLFALLLGTTTELFQWFVSGRYSSLADLLANWLGAFMAGFAVEYVLLARRGVT